MIIHKLDNVEINLEEEDLTGEFLDYILTVASGEETKNEVHDYREISIFKDGIVL